MMNEKETEIIARDEIIAECARNIRKRSEVGSVVGPDSHGKYRYKFPSVSARDIAGAAHELAAIHNDIGERKLSLAYRWIAASLDQIAAESKMDLWRKRFNRCIKDKTEWIAAYDREPAPGRFAANDHEPG